MFTSTRTRLMKDVPISVLKKLNAENSPCEPDKSNAATENSSQNKERDDCRKDQSYEENSGQYKKRDNCVEDEEKSRNSKQNDRDYCIVDDESDEGISESDEEISESDEENSGQITDPKNCVEDKSDKENSTNTVQIEKRCNYLRDFLDKEKSSHEYRRVSVCNDSVDPIQNNSMMSQYSNFLKPYSSYNYNSGFDDLLKNIAVPSRKKESGARVFSSNGRSKDSLAFYEAAYGNALQDIVCDRKRNKRPHSPNKSCNDKRSSKKCNDYPYSYLFHGSRSSFHSSDLCDSDDLLQDHEEVQKSHRSSNKSCNKDGRASTNRNNFSHSYPVCNDSLDPIQNNSIMSQYSNFINPFSPSNYYSGVDRNQSNPTVSQYNINPRYFSTNANSTSTGEASASINTNTFPYPSLNWMNFLSLNSIDSTPIKATMTFKSCTMVAPPPGVSSPSRRARPNGCKTVFVGGLPEKITEEIIREVFSKCGEILVIRMSQKNFCHVRFASECTVDAALLFSGYWIRIEHKEEPSYCSCLLVDFERVQDNPYEYDCKIRTLAREMPRNESLPSQPPVVEFSETEAKTLVKELREGKISFEEACRVIMAWLERGLCDSYNSPTFFSLMQAIDSRVSHFHSELSKAGIELQQAKDKFTRKSIENGKLFDVAKKVLECASMQKVPDCFTKVQRDRLDLCKEKVAIIQHSVMVRSRIEADMKISGEECSDAGNKLREQFEKVNHILQLNYLETKQKLEDAKKGSSGNQKNSFSDKSTQTGSEGLVTACAESMSDMEARLITLISAFLAVHPVGASIDYICSYLETMQSNISTREIENLMRKFLSIFKEESTGIGATLVKKWKYLNLKF